MFLAALTSLLFASAPSWLEHASKRTDAEALQWVKDQLKQDKDLKHSESIPLPTTGKKCITTTQTVPENVPLYVCISFSVPETIWLSLSQEMEKIGAIFSLRGIPENSFKELASRIQHLSQMGVHVPIEINPQLYTDYHVEQVPTFVIQRKETYHKISGNISLSYAIETMGGLNK